MEKQQRRLDTSRVGVSIVFTGGLTSRIIFREHFKSSAGNAELVPHARGGTRQAYAKRMTTSHRKIACARPAEGCAGTIALYGPPIDCYCYTHTACGIFDASYCESSDGYHVARVLSFE